MRPETAAELCRAVLDLKAAGPHAEPEPFTTPKRAALLAAANCVLFYEAEEDLPVRVVICDTREDAA